MTSSDSAGPKMGRWKQWSFTGADL